MVNDFNYVSYCQFVYNGQLILIIQFSTFYANDIQSRYGQTTDISHTTQNGRRY